MRVGDSLGDALGHALGDALGDAAVGEPVSAATQPSLADAPSVPAVLDARVLARLREVDPDGGLLPRLLSLFQSDGALLLHQMDAAVPAHDAEALRFAGPQAHLIERPLGGHGPERAGPPHRDEVRATNAVCPPARVDALRAAFEAACTALAPHEPRGVAPPQRPATAR